MPEAEDVITDAARHATVFAQELWQRHRRDKTDDSRLLLRDVSQRLDLLVAAVFGCGVPIRAAQVPAPPTFLTKVFRRDEWPRQSAAVPATDGISIWLPPMLSLAEREQALAWYRVMAMQQAMRARRGSSCILPQLTSDLEQSIFVVLEAQAADEELVRSLPGMRAPLLALRLAALQARPPLDHFPQSRQSLENFVRSLMDDKLEGNDPPSSAASRQRAQALASELDIHSSTARPVQALYKDMWTGELFPYPASGVSDYGSTSPPDMNAASTPKSARMPRQPKVRDAPEDEDDKKTGAWMVQTSQPHEQAEDPIGMQRPTDRDETTAAEDFADALSELPEARLVSTPGRPKEVLLSDDAPTPRVKAQGNRATGGIDSPLQYPEWDYRMGAYLEPGATVHLLPSQEGAQEWVDRTLREYRSMLHLVQRRFEMLRTQRVRLRKQLEGDEIDLEAYIDSYTDYKAGLPMAQGLYQAVRPERHDVAISLLIDVSGSTDGWISADKRVIDVEREALLLVSIALQGLDEPYSVSGFSGEGPQGVTIRHIKAFDEPYTGTVARRIAAIEPEHYTRAGTAIRHATAELMRQQAKHRLLLLLSDGKPNDVDEYEGRYGVQDTRQAVTEARLQGVSLFCLTIDRQAANYLPAIFGAHHYALLPKPALLPAVLLDWMKRLLSC